MRGLCHRSGNRRSGWPERTIRPSPWPKRRCPQAGLNSWKPKHSFSLLSALAPVTTTIKGRYKLRPELSRKVTRQSLYDGLGAEAVGAGTVGFPGVHLFADLADAAFAPRAARERVAGRASTPRRLAIRSCWRRPSVTSSWRRAAASLQAARQSEADSEQIASLTSAFAEKGQGRQSDAERARDNTLLLHSGGAASRGGSRGRRRRARAGVGHGPRRAPARSRRAAADHTTCGPQMPIWNRSFASPWTIGRKSRRARPMWRSIETLRDRSISGRFCRLSPSATARGNSAAAAI